MPDKCLHQTVWQRQLTRVKGILAPHFASLTEEEVTVIAQSDFLLTQIQQHPTWLTDLRDETLWHQDFSQLCVALMTTLQAAVDETTLMQQLRYYRHYYLTRFAWAQLTEKIPTPTLLHQMSDLAETLIVAAKNWLYRDLCAIEGIPSDEHGQPQPLMVLAMGKLGGRELNFSSDIDLIFVYPSEGQTQGGRRQRDNVRFFTRLSQRLIKVLDQPTAQGIVYRVDMRLRPFGESGPLVMSFDAFEAYYQAHGRDWERYAMVKGRILGQVSSPYQQALTTLLRPFVYRRYIDFGVIKSLRNMKHLIEREARRQGLKYNIKLGAGGIREIEFMTQVFQLIRGGQEKRLQQPSLLNVLPLMASLGLLPSASVRILSDHYLYLRRLENLLQAIDDRQTQTLPDSPLNQIRLAIGMGENGWSALQHSLTTKMAAVHQIFTQMIGDEVSVKTRCATDEIYVDIWQAISNQANQISQTAWQWPKQPDEVILAVDKALQHFRQVIGQRALGERGRQVLDSLMPRILSKIWLHPQIAVILPRLLAVLQNIVTRTTYLELIDEYDQVLQLLLMFCERSPMIAAQLAQHPILLDELLDHHTLYQPLSLTGYHQAIQHHLRYVLQDEEAQLEALRQFKQAQLLHIAAADMIGHLPTMKVSDHLTYLAESLIDQVCYLAWQQMVARYGRPSYLSAQETGFLVIAYGKLGGWELSYSSDLDLVFLTNCPEQDMTAGPKSIHSRQFYYRLAQRMIHLFSLRTLSGVLYEIDLRLRPAGESGLLVCSLDGFAQYQQTSAWIWEHQALVRARAISGDTQLMTQFQHIRHQVLTQKRAADVLQQAIIEMREKMIHHTPTKADTQFDLKQDRGGICDIEFIAQYLVLRAAYHQPELTHWSDNIRIFALLSESGVMSKAMADKLSIIYIKYREKAHQLALQQLPAIVESHQYQKEKQFVLQCWQHYLTSS